MNKQAPRYVPSPVLLRWLGRGIGRAAYFSRVDRSLNPPLISKLRSGRYPVTFAIACRLERAQKPSDEPFNAREIMTFEEDQALHDYVVGVAPRPREVLTPVRAPAKRHETLTRVAGA